MFNLFLQVNTSADPQPVYALTTGHLYYIHDEKSFADVLGGAKPNPGEAILVLKLTDTTRVRWRESYPGRVPFLEECAYLNVQMLNGYSLKDIIRQTATEIYFDDLYKSKTGTKWPGPTEEEPDWETAYVNKFLEYEDWPILVNGGSQIAFTRPNPDLLSEQRLSMFFRVGEQWTAHYDAVRLWQ